MKEIDYGRTQALTRLEIAESLIREAVADLPNRDAEYADRLKAAIEACYSVSGDLRALVKVS